MVASATQIDELRQEWDDFRGSVIREVASLSGLKASIERHSEIMKGLQAQIVELVRRLDESDEWRETTEVKTLRRAQLDRLRSEAETSKEEIDALTLQHANEARRWRRNTTTWVGVAMLIAPAVSHLIEAILTHWK